MKLITSSSPHIRSGETTRRLMGTVLLALLPTLAAGVWFFGLRALLLTLVSVASCVASEWAFRAVTKSPGSIADGSAAVTGLLLALTLPATAPYWLAAVGGVFAIVVVKGLSGGLGQNIFNPALAARAFQRKSSRWKHFMCSFPEGPTILLSSAIRIHIMIRCGSLKTARIWRKRQNHTWSRRIQ